MTKEHKLSYTEHTRWAMDRMVHRSITLLGIFNTKLIDGLKDFIPDSQPSRKLKLQPESRINPSQYILKETEWINKIHAILSQPGTNIKEVLIEQTHTINTENLVKFDITSLPASELPIDPDEKEKLKKHLENVNFSWVQENLQTDNRFNSPRLFHHSGLNKWVMVITLKN